MEGFSFPCDASIALSFAAATAAALDGSAEGVSSSVVVGGASGAWTSHLDRLFLRGGSSSSALGRARGVGGVRGRDHATLLVN